MMKLSGGGVLENGRARVWARVRVRAPRVRAILMVLARLGVKLGLVGVCAASMAGQPVTPGEVALPEVTGPVPQSGDSYAFDAAAHSTTPLDLSKYGYVEQEYFQSGVARIYHWPGFGKLESLGSGPYVTRILVRRPQDPRHFNGAVIVEPLNPSIMADLDIMWMFSHEYFMREGYAWVGISVKPVALEGLKRFNSQRYAKLSLANPLPTSERCPDPELGPDDVTSEKGFAADMESQLGALLRSDAADNPLRGFTVNRVYMTGHSQTAGYVRGYANAISAYARRPGGGPIYDGYLEGGNGPFDVPFNNCAKLFKPGDPRLMVGRHIGVPLIDVAAESDTLVTGFMRQPDGDRAPYLFRRYEVAGATHDDSWTGRFVPARADLLRALTEPPGPDQGLPEPGRGFEGCVPESAPLSDFPLRLILDAAWQNLDAWVVRKIPPPPGTRLTLRKGGKTLSTQEVGDAVTAQGVETVKDEHGNAIGGTRTTVVEVPTATWHSSRGGAEGCIRIGYHVPFDGDRLKKLYPTHVDYVRAVEAAAKKLRDARWLTEMDAETVRAEAAHAAIP